MIKDDAHKEMCDGRGCSLGHPFVILVVIISNTIK